MAENMDKAMDKMNIMKDFEKYVLEHDYSEWTEAEWSEAEKKWSSYPEDSEEFKKLSLLRKQRESKLHDEELYRNYENRQRRERAEMYSMPAPELPEDMMTFAMSATASTKMADYASARKVTPFVSVLTKYIMEKKIKTYAQLCEKTANKVSTSNLSKIMSNNGTKNRDTLWALAIALELNEEQTAKLFESSGLSIVGCSGPREVLKRDILIRSFIAVASEECWTGYSFADLDEKLSENGMKKLCQN